MTRRHTRRAFATPLLLLLLCAAGAGARGQWAYKVDETDYTRCDLSEAAPSAARPSRAAAFAFTPREHL